MSDDASSSMLTKFFALLVFGLLTIASFTWFFLGVTSLVPELVEAVPVITFDKAAIYMLGCGIDAGSLVLPIPGVNVYSIAITLSTCVDPVVDGDYTGFATTQSVADDVLVFSYSNGSFSGSGILPIF